MSFLGRVFGRERGGAQSTPPELSRLRPETGYRELTNHQVSRLREAIEKSRTENKEALQKVKDAFAVLSMRPRISGQEWDKFHENLVHAGILDSDWGYEANQAA